MTCCPVLTRNKVEFVTRIKASGYKFYSILQEFLTHIPHPVADSNNTDMLFLKQRMIELYANATYEFN